MGEGNSEALALAADLIKELFVDQRKVMAKWSQITGQSPQLDSGYIAQHLISLLTGKRGSGWRGKGLDLDDGSEVKCASSVDGIDIPRWNHSFRSFQNIDKWLTAPNIYYVLFDIKPNSSLVRVRIWMITPSSDSSYETVLRAWAALPGRKSDNFQLHPPVSKDSNVATNECGNLELPLMFLPEEDADKVVVKFFQESGLPTSTLINRPTIKEKKGRYSTGRQLPFEEDM